MPSVEKIAKYKRLLSALLPVGRLWDTANQPTLSGLLEGLAPELARVDDRTQDALREIDPRQTSELLDRWETVLGLPDECTPETPTPDDRRLQILQRYTAVGGLSGSYYEFLISQLGFASSVTKWKSFKVGQSQVGDPLTNDFDVPFRVGMKVGQSLRAVGWLFYFNVDIPASAVVPFRVGQSQVGDPLVEFGNPLVQCTIKKLKPAHAGVTFTYTL